jgi:hypothetical protein
MIWTTLMAICVLSSAFAAYQTAAGAGVRGHGVALLIGAAIGLGSAAAMQTSVGVLERRLSHLSARTKERVFGAVYLAAVVFTLVSVSVAIWVTTTAVRPGG